MPAPATSLAIVIRLPPQAIVPLLVATAALLVLAFAGSALARWKASNPAAATRVGSAIAAALTAYAVYRGIVLLPAKYIDHGAPGELTIGFLDGPIMGMAALVATLFWSYANQRWIATAVGLGVGLAMFAKPFIAPLYGYYDGREHPWHFMDPEHLSFHGPGLAVLIAALIVMRKRA